MMQANHLNPKLGAAAQLAAGAGQGIGHIFGGQAQFLRGLRAVSYTHLTLPTIA